MKIEFTKEEWYKICDETSELICSVLKTLPESEDGKSILTFLFNMIEKCNKELIQEDSLETFPQLLGAIIFSILESVKDGLNNLSEMNKPKKEEIH